MRLCFCGGVMKSLSELAEDYYAEAQRLKKKIDELEAAEDTDNPSAVNHTLAVYRDMYLEQMSLYYKLKNYYR